MSVTRSGRVRNPGQVKEHSLQSSAPATLAALERRVNELEHLVGSQRHGLRIQFERIAQLQADRDVLRIRGSFPASGQPEGTRFTSS
jgi:hypothetical protein